MAIATSKANLYSDQAAVDQLLEKVAAKVRAQLAAESLKTSNIDAENVDSKDIDAKNAQSVDVQSVDADSFELRKIASDEVCFTGVTPQSVDFEGVNLTVTSAWNTELKEPVLEVPPIAFAGVDIRQMAADGYFQAIAYWLNERLVPQNVYAQVLADELPGRLRVLIEFERAPQAERLARFVCDRLYSLNSDVIEGVHLIVCPLGSAQPAWERSIRIPTATVRAHRKAQQVAAPPITAPPKTLLHESSTSQRARQVVQGQFKFFRAALVCGSAIAALLFGSAAKLIFSHQLSVASITERKDAALPWYGEAAEPDFSQASEVSFRPASRFKGRTVEAALETVAVIPHNAVVNPSDPTVTLLFGGDLSLNNFVFEEASEVDQLFSEIDIYQKADVAMMGLAEPLAYASTSLQEDFHQRTRPQAAKALEAGGIDIVGLASEGTMTYGERGLKETLDNLDRQGIYRVGAGRDQQEAHRPEILEVKGQRIAYLGYNPDALKGADFEKAGVALASSVTRKHIVEDIRAIRPQVDWVVVNYRWGDITASTEESAEEPTDEPVEESPDTSSVDSSKTTEEDASTTASALSTLTAAAPEDWQKSLAHEAVDAGADLVVGYHPSHVQGTEIYRDRAIAYSLGDFTFDSTSAQKHDTTALKVSLRNQQMKVEFLPLTIQDAKLKMATGEHGAEILQTIRKASKTLANPLRFPTVIKAPPTPASKAVVPPQPIDDDTWVIDRGEPVVPLERSEPNTGEADISQPNSASESLSESAMDQSNSSHASEPASNPMMREPEALFAPKADQEALDQQWQDEDLHNQLQDEALLDAWGEKQTDSEPAFTPIPAGTIERQQLGDEPEQVAPLGNAENNTEASSTEDASENQLESSNFEPWQDPFADDFPEDTFEKTASEDSFSENSLSGASLSEDSLEERIPEDSLPEGLSSEDSPSKDLLSENIPVEDSLSEVPVVNNPAQDTAQDTAEETESDTVPTTESVSADPLELTFEPST